MLQMGGLEGTKSQLRRRISIKEAGSVFRHIEPERRPQKAAKWKDEKAAGGVEGCALITLRRRRITVVENKVLKGESSVGEQRDSSPVQRSPLRRRLGISVRDRAVNRAHRGLRAGGPGVREEEHKDEGRGGGKGWKMIMQRDRLKP